MARQGDGMWNMELERGGGGERKSICYVHAMLRAMIYPLRSFGYGTSA